MRTIWAARAGSNQCIAWLAVTMSAQRPQPGLLGDPP